MELNPDPKKISCSILLFVIFLSLLGSVEGENGSAYSTYYVSDYDVLNGVYVSGSFPESVQTADSDYLTIQSVASVTTASTYPSEYTPLGSTNWISGDLSNLASEDDFYMTFRSYYSGIDVADFVDNDTSNVDLSDDKGTHSSFLAQTTGPDSIYDTLTEDTDLTNVTLVNAESFEDTWPPVGWTETDAWNKETDRAYDGIYSADFDGPLFGTASGDLSTPNLNCSNAVAIYVDFWYRDHNCDSDDFLLNYYNGSNWNTISDLGSTIQEDQWLHYQQIITDNQYFLSTFRVRWSAVSVSGGENIWVDLVTLKEESSTNNYELDLEVQWANVDYDEMNEELGIYVDKGNNTHSLDASGGHMIIGDGTPDWGSMTGTISFWIKWNIVANRPWGQHDNMETRISGSNLVIDWGAAGSITSTTVFTVGKWYFIAIVWNENSDELYLYVGDQINLPSLDTLNNAWASSVSTVGVTENNFMASRSGIDPIDGRGEDLRYWDINRTLAEIQSDYDTELAGSETNLRSYFKLNGNIDDVGADNNDGSGSGSYSFSSDVPFSAPPTENIRVDAWNGITWENLFTDLSTGWNNISVSSFLISSTFTIRFQGGTETGDTFEDCWHIDAALLHVWSDTYASEVELTGASNTEDWSQLDWTIDSAWTISSVNVTIQLYNHILDGYPTGGSGYIAYTSNDTPNTDEDKSQTINVNPTHFRNATGHWKMKIKGIKTTDTLFDFKADEIEFKSYRSEHIVSTEFFFSDMTLYTATELNLSVISQFSVANVNVLIQIWNYSSSAYADHGESCLKYTSNEPNETRTLNISVNPLFYVSDGNAKARITCMSTESYEQEINQIKILYGHFAADEQFLDWRVVLYVAPILFGLLFFLILKRRPKKKTEPEETRKTKKTKKTRKTKPNIKRKSQPFSSSFGMTHRQMVGKKMLLEIDPTRDYQEALSDFVSEAENSGENPFIFTSANSTLHSEFSSTENVRFFLLASKASSAQQLSQTETLLPASDLSVLLNTFIGIQNIEMDKNKSILFDNLSDTILLCGFEKTYKFIRWLLEAGSSPKATALFVFNPKAHDIATSSSIRGLFQTRLAYTKKGLKIGTL